MPCRQAAAGMRAGPVVHDVVRRNMLRCAWLLGCVARKLGTGARLLPSNAKNTQHLWSVLTPLLWRAVLCCGM